MKSLANTSMAMAAIAAIVLGSDRRAIAQLAPRPWVSVGIEDSEPTFSVGVRALGFGAELGLTNDSTVGVDVMKFINPPFISQVSGYVGVGLYDDPDSDDRDLAFSGGVQVFPEGNIFFGAGYHSIRGINGQIGIKLF